MNIIHRVMTPLNVFKMWLLHTLTMEILHFSLRGLGFSRFNPLKPSPVRLKCRISIARVSKVIYLYQTVSSCQGWHGQVSIAGRGGEVLTCPSKCGDQALEGRWSSGTQGTPVIPSSSALSGARCHLVLNRKLVLVSDLSLFLPNSIAIWVSFAMTEIYPDFVSFKIFESMLRPNWMS